MLTKQKNYINLIGSILKRGVYYTQSLGFSEVQAPKNPLHSILKDLQYSKYRQKFKISVNITFWVFYGKEYDRKS